MERSGPFSYLKEEVMDEGTFTGAGTDSLAPRPATEHVAAKWEPEPRTRWQRVLAWFGLGE